MFAGTTKCKAFKREQGWKMWCICYDTYVSQGGQIFNVCFLGFYFEKVVWISPMLWKENDWSLISYGVTVTSYLDRSCADGSKWKPKWNIGSSCACPSVGLIKHIPQILIRHNASDNADSISSPSFSILSIFVLLFDNSD